MGFLDKAKRSLTQAVDRHGDTIAKSADQVGRIVNQRTGNPRERTVPKRDVPAPREPRDTDPGPAAGRS